MNKWLVIVIIALLLSTVGLSYGLRTSNQQNQEVNLLHEDEVELKEALIDTFTKKVEERETEIEELNKEIDRLLAANETAQEAYDQSYEVAEAQIQILTEENRLLEDALRLANEPGYGATYVLSTKGIEDYNIIIDDLRRHPELIGYEGILGGTMYFSDVKILTKDWAFAFFEDGHYGGYGLYEFVIDSQQEIHWDAILEVVDQ